MLANWADVTLGSEHEIYCSTIYFEVKLRFRNERWLERPFEDTVLYRRLE